MDLSKHEGVHSLSGFSGRLEPFEKCFQALHGFTDALHAQRKTNANVGRGAKRITGNLSAGIVTVSVEDGEDRLTSSQQTRCAEKYYIP